MVCPQLFLFATRHCVSPENGAELHAVLKLAAGGEHNVSSSRLVARDASGRELWTQADWLRLEGQQLRGPLVRAPLFGWARLPPGDLAVEWQLDGLCSAPIGLSVAEDPSRGPDFWPPRLDWLGPPVGVQGEPDLLVRLTNPGDQVLDDLHLLVRSRLILDGAAYAFEPPAVWDGPFELTPGESRAYWLPLARYQLPSPGRHQLAVELAGARTNSLTLEI